MCKELAGRLRKGGLGCLTPASFAVRKGLIVGIAFNKTTRSLQCDVRVFLWHCMGLAVDGTEFLTLTVERTIVQNVVKTFVEHVEPFQCRKERPHL